MAFSASQPRLLNKGFRAGVLARTHMNTRVQKQGALLGETHNLHHPIMLKPMSEALELEADAL